MQRWSKLFIPTLREAPADAEVASHKLLLRAGYIRQLGAGLYSYLFLGQRSVNKIIAIVREEMDTIAQEFLLPALNPREVWEESGRWTSMGGNMFRLKDRKGADLCLGMTHEEVMTTIARSELRSYKQLPQIWYQIQNKFRDEPRPKSGLLRVRQFTMKDAYSFDIDAAGLDESYRKHDEVYRRIFKKCGLDFVAVDADSGAMGGSQSQEFMVYTDAGEDLIASCPVCGYAANVEKATSRLDAVAELEPVGDGKPELVHTPGQKTIDEVGAFLKVAPQHQMKTMAYVAEFITARKPLPDPSVQTFATSRQVVVLLRGDHQVNEAKLAAIFGAAELRPAHPEEVERVFKASAGYLGPIGIEAAPHLKKPGTLVILDSALEGRSNLIAGANKEEYHLRNVTPSRDFTPTLVADVRTVNEGEGCPNTQQLIPGAVPQILLHPFRPDGICTGTLDRGKAVEVGHIFKLGYRYSESMGARVLDRDGKEVTPIMGSYGIGIERILTAAIETAAASVTDPRSIGNSFALPPSIAPFEVVVTVTNSTDATLAEAGEKVAAALEAAGIDVLLDDRDERAGVKFKDADLIGIPLRLNVGKKLAEGKLELVNRLTGESVDVVVDDAVASVRKLLG
jgi:prolyl-tRNA synthetase